jgi:hypothetical protein
MRCLTLHWAQQTCIVYLYISVCFLFFLEHYNENVESDIDPDMIVVEMEKISVMFERQVLSFLI